MNEFMSLAVLGTFSGMVLAVTVLTQVIKYFVKGPDPKWFALAVAFVLVLVIQVLPFPVSPDSILLGFANWLIVTGSSVGLFEGGKSVGKMLGLGSE